MRLFGVDMELLRAAAYNRSDGFCECDECARRPPWRLACWKSSLPDINRESAHNEHGPWKSDELRRGKWKNRLCPRVREHG
jgi:hypothetical protein